MHGGKTDGSIAVGVGQPQTESPPAGGDSSSHSKCPVLNRGQGRRPRWYGWTSWGRRRWVFGAVLSNRRRTLLSSPCAPAESQISAAEIPRNRLHELQWSGPS